MRKALLLALIFVACSGSSFGRLVDTLRFLKYASGTLTVLFVGHGDAGAIVVVEGAALGRGQDKDFTRRIVLKVEADGGVTLADGVPLVTDEEITKYLRVEKTKSEVAGLVPALQLRASDEAAFESVRRVMHLASKLIIDEITFASLRAVDADAAQGPKLALPDYLGLERAPIIVPLLIAIDAKGGISLNSGPAREELDQDAADHELPLLGQRVEMYAVAAGVDPKVELYVEEGVKQQRVIDVLQVLSRSEISKVTFMDLDEED